MEQCKKILHIIYNYHFFCQFCTISWIEVSTDIVRNCNGIPMIGKLDYFLYLDALIKSTTT